MQASPATAAATNATACPPAARPPPASAEPESKTPPACVYAQTICGGGTDVQCAGPAVYLTGAACMWQGRQQGADDAPAHAEPDIEGAHWQIR